MEFISYLELNILAFLICAIVFCFRIRTENYLFANKVYNVSLVITAVVVILDSISVFASEGVLKIDYATHMTVLSIYTACQSLLSMLMAKYCIKKPGRRIGGFFDALLSVPLLANVVAIIVNAIVPFAFYVNENNVYERLDGFYLMILCPALYLVISLVTCIYNFIVADETFKNTATHLVIFTFINIAGSLVAVLVNGFSLWPVVAVNLCYLFMSVKIKHGHDAAKVAFVDSLTGIQNAAAYRTMLFNIDNKISEGTAEFAVVVMDISGLKLINDKYGHSAGDSLIIKTSSFISQIFKNSPVFRIGGDEFVAILENKDYEIRNKLIESFHEGISGVSLEIDGDSVPVVIAIGMAMYKEEKEMLYADVFKLADRRMYEHKKSQKADLLINSAIT